MGNNKIQCPSCGATSLFKENSPNRYSCSYCYSHFEHVSIIPAKHIEEILYDTIVDTLNNLLKLSPEQAKYEVRIIQGVVLIDSYLLQLRTSEFYPELFTRYRDFLDKEINSIHSKGIALEATKDFLHENGNYFRFYSSILFHKTIAIHLARIHNDEDGLLEALSYSTNARKMQDRFIEEYDQDIIRCNIGILQRLERHAEVFEYIDSLFEKYDGAYNEIEQLRFDLEEVFNSELYKKYKESGT